MPFPFRYSLTNSEVQVCIGGWVCARVRYDQIQAIRITSAFFGITEKYPNIWPATKAGVLIIRKSGAIRNFYITPVNPENFARELVEKSLVTDFNLVNDGGDPKARLVKYLAIALSVAGTIAALAALLMVSHRVR